jgi:microsomal dipeptidase-like Zn-dependent dipeptidase
LYGQTAAAAPPPNGEGDGLFLQAPTLSVEGNRLIFNALEVFEGSPQEGYKAGSEGGFKEGYNYGERSAGQGRITSLQIAVYSGAFIESFPEQLAQTISDLRASEDPTSQKLGDALAAMSEAQPEERMSMARELLRSQDSYFVSDLLAQLDPKSELPVTISLGELAPDLMNPEIGGQLGEAMRLTFWPMPRDGFVVPSQLDLVYPLDFPPPAFPNVKYTIDLVGDYCVLALAANNGNANASPVQSFASTYPYPAATELAMDYTSSGTENIWVSYRNTTTASTTANSLGNFPGADPSGANKPMRELMYPTALPDNQYTVCALGQNWNHYTNTWTSVNAKVATFWGAPRITPPGASATVSVSETVKTNSVTGAKYTVPSAQIVIQPWQYDTMLLSAIQIYRDDFIIGTLTPAGSYYEPYLTSRSGPTLSSCVVGHNYGSAYCVADDLTGQHPRNNVVYRVVKIYNSNWVTATHFASASSTVAIPFAWGWADVHTHMFNEFGFGAKRPASSHLVDTYPAEWTRRESFAWLHGSVAGREDEALTSCGATHGGWYNRNSPSYGTSQAQFTFDDPGWFEDLSTTSGCGSPTATGCFTRSDGIQRNIGANTAIHHVDGYPNFTGWPTAQLFTHQQMWNGWLKRAHAYGLRMATMLAETNREICASRLLAGPEAQVAGSNARALAQSYCDDVGNIIASLQAAKDFETAIDATNPLRQTNAEWFKIVYSPEEARKAIAQGKLAVVLGIEFEEVLGKECMDQNPVTCTLTTKAAVATKVREWYDRGVRHVFPVHLADSAIAGASFYNAFFTGLGWHMNGHWPGEPLAAGVSAAALPAGRIRPSYTNIANNQNEQVNGTNNCGQWPAAFFDDWGNRMPVPQGSGAETRRYRLPAKNLIDPVSNHTYWAAMEWVLNGVFAAFFTPGVQYFGTLRIGAPAIDVAYNDDNSTGHCNAMGMTQIGRWAIQEMMDLGVIIDVDHLTAVARRQIYEMTAARSYPLSAGHATFHANFPAANPAYVEDPERSLDGFDMSNLLRNRGLVAPRINQHFAARSLLPAAPAGNPVPECNVPSARSFAHAQSVLVTSANAARTAGLTKDAYFDAVGGGLAIGSDFNGLIDMPAARYLRPPGSTVTVSTGVTVCGGSDFAYNSTTSTLKQPGNLPATTISPWRSSHATGATFDYNTRGVATVGQIPEFIADLKNVGLTDEHVDPIYRGAEAYLRMWEQAEWAGKPIVSDGSWRAKVVPLGTATVRNARSEDVSAWGAVTTAANNAYPPPSNDVFTSLAGLAPTTNASRYMAASAQCLTACPAGDYLFRKTFDITGAWETDLAKLLRMRAAVVGNTSSFDTVKVYIDDLQVGTLFELAATVAGSVTSVTQATQLYVNGASARAEGRHVLTVVLSHATAGAAAVRLDMR